MSKSLKSVDSSGINNIDNKRHRLLKNKIKEEYYKGKDGIRKSQERN